MSGSRHSDSGVCRDAREWENNEEKERVEEERRVRVTWVCSHPLPHPPNVFPAHISLQ